MRVEEVAVMSWQTTQQGKDFQAALQQDIVLLALEMKVAPVAVGPAEKDLIPVLQQRLRKQMNMPQFQETVVQD